MKAAMPSIFVNPQFVAVGGLMRYGGTNIEIHYVAGGYVGRILRTPVIQGTNVELCVNLNTAKALGIDVPISKLEVPTR